MTTGRLSRPPREAMRNKEANMRSTLISILTAGALALPAAAQERPTVGDPPEMPEETFHMEPDGIAVEPYVTGLEAVWDIVFLPDGSALVSERPGRIRYVDPDGNLQEEPWAAPDPVVGDENGGGMMGLALHPEFPEKPWVYVMYTTGEYAGPANRISRFRHDGTTGVDEEVIVDLMPAGETHFGGRIDFGPDGMLYATQGDTGHRTSAQSTRDLRGSIMRFTPEGDIPEDNPWPETPVWAKGLRNVAGLAFHPDTGALFAADHGPSGEWQDPLIGARDEVNIVHSGENFGWPMAVGAPGLSEYQDPIMMWDEAPLPPGDLTFYDHDLMPELKGDLFLATLRTEALMRFRFEDEEHPYRVTGIERWFTDRDLGNTPLGEGPSQFGRLRAAAIGPDGAIYIGTTNRDRGRGTLREGDDRVLRIAPAEE